MFFLQDPQSASNAVQAVLNTPKPLSGYLPPELALTLYRSVAGSILTLLAAKATPLITERGRRKERVRLVAEASEVLRLRQLLADSPAIAGRKHTEDFLNHLEVFALDNLARVERGLESAESKLSVPSSRTSWARIFLFYMPSQNWLWIFQGLFVAFLISTVWTTALILVKNADNPLVATIEIMFLPGLLFVSTIAVNLLGNYFDLKACLGELESQAMNGGHGDGANPPIPKRNKLKTLFLIYRPARFMLGFFHLFFYLSTPFAIFGTVVIGWVAATQVHDFSDIEALFLVFAVCVYPTVLWNLLANLSDALSHMNRRAATSVPAIASPVLVAPAITTQ